MGLGPAGLRTGCTPLLSVQLYKCDAVNALHAVVFALFAVQPVGCLSYIHTVVVLVAAALGNG